MAVNVADYLPLLGVLQTAPGGELWSSDDREADVLYVHFEEPSAADDSELTDDDVIIRFKDEEVIGFTVLHASKREGTRP
ncbi:MAG: DUF2283 domain-containing protein [Hyphomicrobiales bacterium]